MAPTTNRPPRIISTRLLIAIPTAKKMIPVAARRGAAYFLRNAGGAKNNIIVPFVTGAEAIATTGTTVPDIPELG
jgi:hypothetical protein